MNEPRRDSRDGHREGDVSITHDRGPAWALRALGPVAALLAIATGILFLAWGRGGVLLDVPWFNAFAFTLQAVTCASASVLLFGRHRVLHDPTSYWSALGFASYGIVLVFYVLTWPGTLPGDRALVPSLPGTAAWYSLLAPLLLWIGLLGATLARWSGPDPLRERRRLLGIAAWLGATLAACALLLAFETRLPVLVRTDGGFTSLLRGLNALFVLLFAAGTAISAVQSRRTNDGLLALTGCFQLAFVFVSVWIAIGGVRFGPWWYLARAVLTAAALVVLLGLLAEYAGVLRREREKSRRLTERSAKLAAIEAQLREQNAELQRAHAQLQDADRRKTEFLAMLSHELRNPLAPIVHALFLLDGGGLGQDHATRALALLQRQVAHLTRLLDDLLDATRIARGKVELRRARLDLGALLRELLDDHRGLLRERGLELIAAVPDEPVWLHADETRIAQVVGNLLQNAGAFTPPGGRVDVALARDGEVAEIVVRDTGRGIESDLVGRIFEPFTQGRPASTRPGGLGLGLAIARGLVELHGGTLTGASAGPGAGAEFTVRLPALAASSDAPLVSARADRAAPPRRVLVVDDNRDAAESLAALVRLFGHEAHLAHDGVEAVEAARRTAPHVIFCDLGLPGMDGYEVARAIRAERGDGVRLVAVSGYARPEDRRAAADAGFDEHLAKPADPRAIRGQLAQ